MQNILFENNVDRANVEWLKKHMKDLGNVKAHEMFGKLQTGEAHLENGEFVLGPATKKSASYSFNDAFKRKEQARKTKDPFSDFWKEWDKDVKEKAEKRAREQAEEARRRAEREAFWKKWDEDAARRRAEREAFWKKWDEDLKKAREESKRKAQDATRARAHSAGERIRRTASGGGSGTRNFDAAYNKAVKNQKIARKILKYSLAGAGVAAGGYGLYKWLNRKRDLQQDW